MSALDSLTTLMDNLEANWDKLIIEEEHQELIKWLISHTFNSYIPAIANLKAYLEGKTPNLVHVEILQSLSTPVEEKVIVGADYRRTVDDFAPGKFREKSTTGADD